MSRWESLKTYLSEWLVDLEDGEIKFDGYSQVKCILAKMKELDALPVVEVEVPETNKFGDCSTNCPMCHSVHHGWKTQVGSDYSQEIIKGDCSLGWSIESKYDKCKPGPNCPRHVKGEKE